MPNINTIIDGLRELSLPMNRAEVEELNFIQRQSFMIGEIFGIYPPYGQQLKQSERMKRREKKEVKDMKIEKKVPSAVILPPTQMSLEEKRREFEEKRKLFETKFPNAVSSERRARAREILNLIANNQAMQLQSPYNHHAAAENDFNVISSSSWSSDSSTGEMEEGMIAVGGEEIRGDTGKDASVFPGVWKFGSYDNFSKMTYDQAFSNTTQSQSTLLNETSTPITSFPESSPLNTCIV